MSDDDHKWMVTFSFNRPSPNTNETHEIMAPSAEEAFKTLFERLDWDDLEHQYGADGTLRKLEAHVHGLVLTPGERHAKFEPQLSIPTVQDATPVEFIERVHERSA